MIKNYKDRRTERLARGELVRALEPIATRAMARLASLEAATPLGDLAVVRGHRLERLKGDRAGQHSIRINDQWRICFIWNNPERCAEQVEIVDYH
jgi:proteic killer suppression protein